MTVITVITVITHGLTQPSRFTVQRQGGIYVRTQAYSSRGCFWAKKKCWVFTDCVSICPYFYIDKHTYYLRMYIVYIQID